MEAGPACEWFLLKDEDKFAIQYTGPDPDLFLPTDLDGKIFYKIYNSFVVDTKIMEIINKLYARWTENELDHNEMRIITGIRQLQYLRIWYNLDSL